jgi:very-short-patch-repair endonuclease
MKISENLLLASRKLRKEPTPWENKLWYYLRAKRFKSFKFRRQFVIAGYIVDFCCHEKKLIIELDGGQHNEKYNRLNDAERTKILNSLDFRVLRFWNNEIDENIEGVLDTIYKELTK